MAFSDSIMAELYRLEVQNADKSQNGISFFRLAMSFVRRYMGILGSIECLQEQQFDVNLHAD